MCLRSQGVTSSTPTRGLLVHRQLTSLHPKLPSPELPPIMKDAQTASDSEDEPVEGVLPMHQYDVNQKEMDGECVQILHVLLWRRQVAV